MLIEIPDNRKDALIATLRGLLYNFHADDDGYAPVLACEFCHSFVEDSPSRNPPEIEHTTDCLGKTLLNSLLR